MGLGMILDDVCVYIGVIVVWMVKGGKYSLCDKLSEVKAFDFLRRREGIIGLATIIAISGLCGLFMHFLDKLQTIAVHFVIGTQKFMRKFRGRFICLQSARGLAQSKTLRVFQESSCCAQRLGVRWPSTAFPGGISNCAMLTGTVVGGNIHNVEAKLLTTSTQFGARSSRRSSAL